VISQRILELDVRICRNEMKGGVTSFRLPHFLFSDTRRVASSCSSGHLGMFKSICLEEIVRFMLVSSHLPHGHPSGQHH
jgi:hypothetical protein